MDGVRIGRFGEPSDWLVASSPDANILKERLGVDVVPVALEELRLEMKALDSADISGNIERFIERADVIVEPSPEDLQNVGAVFLGLKALIQRYQLDALTIRCFDLVVDDQTTGCYALSQLLDEGVIAACEGDLVSTVGMLLAKTITGETPWMANPSMIDADTNKLILAHCTVPRKIVETYSIRSHFESGLGVGIQGIINNGPVTVFRLGGKSLEKSWIAEGEIISAGLSENLCRTQVEIKLHSRSIKELLEHPLGNHLVLIRGHHEQELLSGAQNISEGMV
ncbi:MAG: fucose isomerase [Candidatus Marinimicrobia bacterium]|nr:fucose isomerase [Candidatus Neomarinimicrobiota bacterium]